MLQTSVLPKLFFLTLETKFEVESQEKMAYYHNDYKKVRPFSLYRRGGRRQAYEKDFLKCMMLLTHFLKMLS